MSLSLDLLAVDRMTALKTWLTYHGVSFAELGRRLGVSESRIAHILRGRCPSPEQLQALKECGIPEALLPPPGKRKAGRPTSIEGASQAVVASLRELGGAVDTQLRLLELLKAKGMKLTTAQGAIRRAVQEGLVIEEILPKKRKRYRLMQETVAFREAVSEDSNGIEVL